MTSPRAGRDPGDLVAYVAATSIFALSLGISTVSFPLLAASRGFSTAEIGFVIGIAQIAQFPLRMILPPLMRRFTEVAVVSVAGLLVGGAFVAMSSSATMAAFVGSQVILGGGRACFWTAVQTQSVRSPDGGRRLAILGTTTGVGLLIGPLIAGLLGSVSLTGAMAVGATLAVVSVLPSLRLHRFDKPTRSADRTAQAIWRGPGVVLGSWAAVTAGCWRAMLNAYLPVVLQAAGYSTAQIGLLLAVANLANIIGVSAALPMARRSTAGSLVGAVAITAGSMALFGIMTSTPWFVMVVLFCSGLGGGALQTLAPSVAVVGLDPWQKGNAMAVIGAWRSGAMLVAPLSVAAALAFVSFGAASGVLGVVLLSPLAGPMRSALGSIAATSDSVFSEPTRPSA